MRKAGTAPGVLAAPIRPYVKVKDVMILMGCEKSKASTYIKDINDTKIALSLKFEDQNPWLDAAVKYAPGNIVEGRVARMTDFGAFVELEPGVDALLHFSQISREHVEKPSDVLRAGQEITAKVVDFNGEDKNISLSMKALAEAPAQAVEEETYELPKSEALSTSLGSLLKGIKF